MEFWRKVLEILDTGMERPSAYGWFHIMFFVLSFAVAVLLCFLYSKGYIKNVKRVVFITALIVIALEVYKMINFGFSYENEIEYSFPWSSFPWQFCSTPMYVGFLAGLTRGKVHDALCCFLATFAVFAGAAVMVHPGDVFIETIGINIQTMICHGSMITIGIFLYYTNHVKTEWKTILKAIPVFVCCLAVAVILNEVGHAVGLTEDHFFNMFYVSRHEEGHLPIYSDVQKAVPYPWCFIIYILGFSLAAFVVLLVAMGIKWVIQKQRGKKTHAA
jgi:hypothetical protein